MGKKETNTDLYFEICYRVSETILNYRKHNRTPRVILMGPEMFFEFCSQRQEKTGAPFPIKGLNNSGLEINGIPVYRSEDLKVDSLAVI